ncbi:hypothetical protein NLI96_g11552 [Meripilus lineatus]|uniref:Uncharacterized protein n=1 Tax=Meripilus lineatus TaxID=2056292 RepID=A0AAD5URQ9_9APHY|nr:hypothetical protein NLI96_g11552 [Physisporinus lineatus]
MGLGEANPITAESEEARVKSTLSVAPANKAGPSKQANKNILMSEVKQGIANMTQLDLGTEQEKEPYYKRHDPLTFGTSSF